MIDWMLQLSHGQAVVGSIVLNVVVFLISLAFGYALLWRFSDRRVTAEPDPLETAEVWLSIGCVFLNSLVAYVGWLLWRSGFIVLRDEWSWRIFRDLLVLLVVMDLAMYIAHRVAHHPRLYPLVHATHHRYDRPRPLNLFVLNPFEVLGFGTLWLLVRMIYPFTWIGMLLFLTLNTIFGTIGHLGVEPFPAAWKRLPMLKHLGSSTFHAGHHQNGRVNFGFYSNIWDRLFRTGER